MSLFGNNSFMESIALKALDKLFEKGVKHIHLFRDEDGNVKVDLYRDEIVITGNKIDLTNNTLNHE